MSKNAFIEAMLKQLPPSASTLHLLDVGGVAGMVLRQYRPDIQPLTASLDVTDWTFAPQSADAIVAYDYPLKSDFLARAYQTLRAGGRLIVVLPLASFATHYGETLAQAGYVRLLVESATEFGGVLIRGERAHTTADTQTRIQQVAQADADAVDWSGYTGRFVHVLVRQTPNKPAWRLTPADVIMWQGVALATTPITLLGFSSLPKAVAVMQDAVVKGYIQGVNKVAKFRREVVQGWDVRWLLNPTTTMLDQQHFTTYTLNPNDAETPDE